MKKKIFLTLGALAMCAGLTVYIPNTVLAESKAAVINTVSSEYTGWVENDNGTMSYYQDGEMIKGKVIEIDYRYYLFYDNGEMVFDRIIYGDKQEGKYYVNKEGKYVRNTWIKPDVNGGYTYFYAGSDGKLKCDGWAMINGSWY